MTDELERRWDDAMERAWVGLRRALGDELAALADGEAVVVAVAEDPDEGAAPYCQVAAFGDGWLRVEAVSNEFLADEAALAPEQEERLLGLGLRRPSAEDGPNFWLHLEQREADRAAWVAVQALRSVYGVLHPVLLTGVGVADPPPEPAGGTPEPAETRDADFPPRDGGPWSPADDVEVRACVHRIVREMIDDEPEWDDDGDLPLHTERGVMYVVFARSVPRILLSATLVTDVVDEQRAMVEVNLLNARHFGLTFVLDGDRVVVRRELAVGVFVPHEVRAELTRVLDGLDGWVVDLRARVGGRGLNDDAVVAPRDHRPDPGRTSADGAQQERYRAAYDVLSELEREERGSVGPTMLVRIFHGDRALLMLAIAATGAREAHWRDQVRKQEREGTERGARLGRSRLRYQRELRARLRRALRITVGSQDRREAPEQLALFAEEDANG